MTHPFQKANLGTAPFRCVCVRTNWFEIPGFGRKPGGTCDYCGTGILYEYQIESSDGKKFVVGCDCVRKTGSDVSGFTEVRAKHSRELRQMKATVRREQRQAAYAQKKKEWEAARQASSDKFVEDHPEIAGYLIFYSGKNNFILTMANTVRRYGSLTAKQLEVLTNIIDKHEKKRKSKHVGVVGEKTSVNAKVVYVYQSGSIPVYPYTPQYTNVLETEAGDTITWRTNKVLEKGDFQKVKFTVKSHTEYEGCPQTQVIRLTIA